MEGYSVHTAQDGLDALKKLEDIPHPCLILLDYYMPVMNGHEFLTQIKKDKHTIIATIPVVLVSAALESNIDAKDQFQGFIKKPIDLDLLLKAVQSHCGAGN